MTTDESQSPRTITGQLVDTQNRQIVSASVRVEGGRIVSVERADDPDAGFLMPGFVDSHVHIESSMLVPSAFGEIAVRHGTVATVSDPHEIGNVLGVEGVNFMLEDAERTPVKMLFGAPSCVPATSFESAGAVIGVSEVEMLLDDPRIGYLAEMMNYPGVVHGDPAVLAKIAAARTRGKPVDGHAPMLSGEALKTYVGAGITTDHECTTEAEAREKLGLGMKIAVREGSAARNFDALAELIGAFPGRTMLCSDDKHPDELVEGHIDRLVQRAVAGGLPLWNVLEAACLTPVAHYGMDVGLLRPGDPADFIRVDDLASFAVRETWIDGACVWSGDGGVEPVPAPPILNRFTAPRTTVGDFALRAEGVRMRVIVAVDGSIVTGSDVVETPTRSGMAVADPTRDLLKMTVVNRYGPAPPAVAFVRGVGLRRGAIASSVAHDSHNIVAVGADDESLARAVHLVGRERGGLAVVGGAGEVVLPLPIAGLMTAGSAFAASEGYKLVDQAAKALGSPLSAPFMTLSFLALLVIPTLKLGDRGLFDGSTFEFVPLFVD